MLFGPQHPPPGGENELHAPANERVARVKHKRHAPPNNDQAATAEAHDVIKNGCRSICPPEPIVASAPVKSITCTSMSQVLMPGGNGSAATPATHTSPRRTSS